MLSPKTYNAIPYEGNEILIFKSDSNQRDTIFITGTTSTIVSGGDPFSINPDRFEHLRIDYTTATRTDKQGLLYLSWLENSYDLRFEFDAGHSRLFKNYTFSKSEYDSIPPATLNLMDSVYKDVKIIHSEVYYDDRPERIINFYWGTTSGLLGWDTPLAQWRLIKIE